MIRINARIKNGSHYISTSIGPCQQLGVGRLKPKKLRRPSGVQPVGPIREDREDRRVGLQGGRLWRGEDGSEAVEGDDVGVEESGGVMTITVFHVVLVVLLRERPEERGEMWGVEGRGGWVRTM